MLPGRMNVNIAELTARVLAVSQGYHDGGGGTTAETEQFVCVLQEVETCHCHAESLPCCQSVR